VNVPWCLPPSLPPLLLLPLLLLPLLLLPLLLLPLLLLPLLLQSPQVPPRCHTPRLQAKPLRPSP
jgi:corin